MLPLGTFGGEILADTWKGTRRDVSIASSRQTITIARNGFVV
jgi:hypothetical protein